jgi:cystathionine beta-synthase
MGAPLPQVGSHESAQTATKALRDADALLVVEDGHPVGVLTRADLLELATR